MADRCELTELLVDQCGHCLKTPSIEDEIQADRKALIERGWFAAEFAGVCGTCRVGFGPGTAIQYHPNGWIAECCAEVNRG